MSTAIAEAEARLRAAGQASDSAIDLAETALALAVLDHPAADLAAYRGHLARLARDVAAASGPVSGLDGRLRALRDVLVGAHGYRGDRETYDDLANADLMRVIDRRRGLPVALAILWLHATRAQGWSGTGLNFPGHFLIRLDDDGRHAIVDPFNDGATVEATTLTRLIKDAVGEDAELLPEHCAPVGNRDILLRLQNNIKLRLLRAKAQEQAAAVIERMLLIAPREAALWYEGGQLHAAIGNLGAALQFLEQAAQLVDRPKARRHIMAERDTLRTKLN